jgi:hypothetical protein
MVGTLTVQNLQGPTSGANANKVIIPSGQTLDASGGTLVPSAGAVVQVQYVNIYDTTSYDNLTISGGASTVQSSVTIFSKTFTTLYDNSDLLVRIHSGQTKKSGYASNAYFEAFVDGVSTNFRMEENHHHYQNSAGSDFRYYTSSDAYFENVGAAGSKTITVDGHAFIEPNNGFITFNFQGESGAGKRRCQCTVMEIKQ